jgi:hypothetical protein
MHGESAGGIIWVECAWQVIFVGRWVYVYKILRLVRIIFLELTSLELQVSLHKSVSYSKTGCSRRFGRWDRVANLFMVSEFHAWESLILTCSK